MKKFLCNYIVVVSLSYYFTFICVQPAKVCDLVNLLNLVTKGWLLKLGKEKSVKVFLEHKYFHFSVLDKDKR
jgi:hypothetical protein